MRSSSSESHGVVVDVRGVIVMLVILVLMGCGVGGFLGIVIGSLIGGLIGAIVGCFLGLIGFMVGGMVVALFGGLVGGLIGGGLIGGLIGGVIGALIILCRCAGFRRHLQGRTARIALPASMRVLPVSLCWVGALMPHDEGADWLAEVMSYLAETPDKRTRRSYVRSFLRKAAQLIWTSWTEELSTSYDRELW